jgi:hypothetical protein
MTAMGFTGQWVPRFCNAFGTGFVNYVRTQTLQTNALGVVGGGSGVGKFLLVPVAGIPLITASLAKERLVGQWYTRLATAISIGVGTYVTASSQTATGVAGVGTGAEIAGRMVNLNDNSLASLLRLIFLASGFKGERIGSLSSGLATGINLYLRTGIVVAAVVGSPAPPFAVTSSTGVGKVL